MLRQRSTAMINFSQLRAFFEAARTGSYSRAASSLFLTQPAISAQIKALEESFGFKLFRKLGRQMVLTEAGSELFQYARRIFELETEIEKMVSEIHKLERGVLKVPSIMTRFHSAHPAVKIVLDEGSSLEMLKSVLELRNELGIMAKVEEFAKIEYIPFARERIVLFASTHHPFAKEGKIRFKDLNHQPIIMKERGSGTHATVTRCFARHGLTPNVLVETSNIDFIKDMVRKGEGVSFLVQQAVEEDAALGHVRIVEIEDEEMVLPVFIVVREGDKLSPAGRAFLEILMQIKEERFSKAEL
jgi:DNA-binding transcriptional LysR family regulator